MPRELIFTSVPKGVKPGSTGYCTVAKHKGIDRLLDQALEKLCFYELMKLPTKPVVHNYSILSLNTGTFHVLTRTCYSGSDHTGRTNYISHNLIFDQSEIYSQQVSPAEIFLRGTGWLSVWPQGQSPTFFQEGTCKVLIPAPSGNPSHLPTWDQLTGKSLLAHELKGYPKWKFITEGGEHHKTLSLLSEFAWLDPSYLQLSWSQLTFTTYLQPSERAANFKIVAGDLSVPAFQAISCTTLNISSTGGANVCFSSTGTGQFGPLPENNQPILDETKEVSEPVPIQPVSDSPNLNPTQPTIVSAQPTTPSVNPSVALPPRQSNLSLNPGQISGSENLFGPDDIPEIKNSKKKSKLLIFLISLISIGVLGAATFAVIYFWPEKATRGKAKPVEVVQAEGQEQTDSDNVNNSDMAESSEGQSVKSEDKEATEINKDIPEPVKPEKPLPKLKSEFYDLVEKAIKNSNDSNETDEGFDDMISQLRSLKSQIEKNFPEEKSNKEYGNKIEQLEELSSNPLPETIPLVIDSRGKFSGFPFSLVDRRPDTPDKTYFWNHKTKTCIDDNNQTAMHEAFWVKNERKDDGSGARIPKFYLQKVRTYSMEKKSFEKLTIPDAYEVKPESQNSVPNLKFPNAGRGARDKRINSPGSFTNSFLCLNKLIVKQDFRKQGNKLEYVLIHESGESALNEEGQLINKDGKVAEMDDKFSYPPAEPILVKEKIENISTQISTVIEKDNNATARYEKSIEELKELLSKKLDFQKQKEELEIQISKYAIDQIKKFKLEKKLPNDFPNAFKQKSLLNNLNWRFKEWTDLKQDYKSYKKNEWEKKEKKERDEFEKEKVKLKRNQKYKEEKEKLEKKRDDGLEKIDKEKTDWEDLWVDWIENKEIPSEFINLERGINSNYKNIAKYMDPLSKEDLEKLEEYKKNLELFVNGPSYPWLVVDQQSEKPILIIK